MWTEEHCYYWAVMLLWWVQECNVQYVWQHTHAQMHVHIHTWIQTMALADCTSALARPDCTSVCFCQFVSELCICIYVIPFTNLHSRVVCSTCIHTSLNSHPSTSPTPSIMLPIRHCRCGSDSCVWSAPADSSELCLPRGPCHKRCKQTTCKTTYSLSITSLLLETLNL